MAYKGKESKEELSYPEEVIPLTIVETDSEDEDITEPVLFTAKSTKRSFSVDAGQHPDVPLLPKLSHFVDMDKEECVDHITSLNEDVEKMLEMPVKFSISDLTSGSDTLLSSRVVDEIKEEAVPDQRTLTPDEFKSHRRESYPHIHQPLKAIKSRSFRNVGQEKKPKVKKVKKKKVEKKKKPAISFPSRSASRSEAIPEADVEEYEDSEASEDSDDELEATESEIVPSESDVFDVESQASAVLPPVSGQKSQNSIPGIKVGFYIGDREKHRDSVTSTGSLVSEALSACDQTPSDARFTDSDMPKDSDVEQLQDKPGADVSKSQEVFSPVLFELGGEPQPSLSAAATPHKSSEGHISVKFLLGSDYPSSEDVWVPMNDHADSTDGKDSSESKISHKLHKSSSDPKFSRHKHKHDKHRHHHHEHYKEEDLQLRRQKGSEVRLEDAIRRVPTEIDEASLLHKADLDDMASHRFEDVRGIRRHKIAKHNAMASIVHIGKADKKKRKMPRVTKKFDHSPHEVFVELDELYVGEERDWEWREKARWIKFEEDVEEGAERWGRPHVASLSFHSLLELRKGLENGSMLLDLEETDLSSIVNKVVDSMIVHDLIKSENKGQILKVLLLKHKHVSARANPAFLRRNISYTNLMGLESFNRSRHQQKTSMKKNLSTSSFTGLAGASNNSRQNRLMSEPFATKKLSEIKNNLMGGDKADVEFVKVDVDNNMQTDGLHISVASHEGQQKQIQDIMKRIPVGAEASTVLVGAVDFLNRPVMSFVRLAEGQHLENLTEVPLPVRFIFILLGPDDSGMDYHEVGRSISTLMSNPHFHDVAYRAESRSELLSAINEFLNESIVLPPGNWDRKTLLPIMDMARKRANIIRRKKQKEEEMKVLLDNVEKYHVPLDPLKRTGRIFGGLINDVKRRYPHYLSDLTDAFHPQCIAAFIFIFFACLSPCIAFGGLLQEATGGYMGLTETVISTSVSGIIFALFAGQPLMIIGATGPVMVFEKSLYTFCYGYGVEVLPFRVWIGLWVAVLSLIAIALESSFLIRYVTRFTEEIFAILISFIFIYEVIKKLIKTYQIHPLIPNYCDFYASLNNSTSNSTGIETNFSVTLNSSYYSSSEGYSVPNSSDTTSGEDLYSEKSNYKIKNQPNTALLSTILVLGTFLLAYFLRVFRNSRFFGRWVKRALGDFGMAIAIISMVLLDHLMIDAYTDKLEVPDRFGPTHKDRKGSWFINPMGMKKPLDIYLIFAALIPGMLLFILLFLEVQVTEMILNKKEWKLKKGSGFHLDQVLVGLITFFCALFGLPWMCAATVRTIAHTSALSVMSSTHAPGEKPKLITVRDQRLTSILMNAFIGISLAWGPVMSAVPMAVLFGVLLYLGVSSLSGIQMFKRFKMLFMPVKHHSSNGFVRRVRTFKMNLYTVIQLGLWIVLWVVKSTPASIVFPLLVILLIPVREKLLPFIFTHPELEELDKEEEESDMEDDDASPDFYQLAHMPI